MQKDDYLQDQINALSSNQPLSAYSISDLEEEIKRRKDKKIIDAYLASRDYSHIEDPWERAVTQIFDSTGAFVWDNCADDLRKKIQKNLKNKEKL